MAYISSLDRKRDYNNTIALAKKEAKAEGRVLGIVEGKHEQALETALSLKNMGIPVDKIAKATGLRIEEIERLK
ncbi:hypothetical protein [Sphingobacterium faecale]|uniref:Transposase/invertase (TIGR01784 family) n=1 Tax=Sphingobacterium faecale TaxID=2803775 RepID=A0ABS1RA18_9SPHI|nr:hypothetical protein [Sphingobacterium faecale]MBL1411541.1 hypothetical protein [Sphingobacterium faecale]